MEEQQQQASTGGSKFAIPASIILASVIVAGAVIYSNSVPGRAGTASVRDTVTDTKNQTAVALDNLKPLTAEDHIRGNPDAPVTIVEFSDTECPFCKQFHKTMEQVVQESNGKVAWIYRHFPLDQLHPKARKEAEATECANELGGNEKFWGYLDRIFEVTPSNNGLDPAELPRIAAFVGLDQKKFETCLTSGKYAKHVEDDYQDAVNSGGAGTPFNVVVTAHGTKIPLVGAQPYNAVKKTIEDALTEK